MTDAPPHLESTWTDDDGRRWGRWSNGQVVEIDALPATDDAPAWKTRGPPRAPDPAPDSNPTAAKSKAELMRESRARRERKLERVVARLDVPRARLEELAAEGIIPPAALNDAEVLNRAAAEEVRRAWRVTR